MNYEILGIGNPIFDICVHIDETELQCLRRFVPNANWHQSYHVADELFNQILECLASAPKKVVAGGGAFNTIRLLAQLQHPTAFAGALGDVQTRLPLPHKDDYSIHTLTADEFRQELQRHHIRDCTVQLAGRPCGRSLCLCHQQREILIFNPAVASLLQEESQLDLAEKCTKPQLLYIEGFILRRHTLVREIIAYCTGNSIPLAVDLGAAPIAAAERDFLLQEVVPHTTYLFGTEEEYSGLDVPFQELYSLLKVYPEATQTPVASHLIVKRGALGSTVLSEDGTLHIDAHPTEMVNSSGAGDAYAAFFLSELLRGAPTEAAARTASYGSSLLLARFGGYIDSATLASAEKIIHTRLT